MNARDTEGIQTELPSNIDTRTQSGPPLTPIPPAAPEGLHTPRRSLMPWLVPLCGCLLGAMVPFTVVRAEYHGFISVGFPLGYPGSWPPPPVHECKLILFTGDIIHVQPVTSTKQGQDAVLIWQICLGLAGAISGALLGAVICGWPWRKPVMSCR